MSQRIHTCMNNTNLDTVHCDAYSCKLRRGKTDMRPMTQQKNFRERSVSRNRNGLQTFQQNAAGPLPKNRAMTIRNQPNSSLLKSEPTNTSVVHKEVYSDNNALVEVTVKTHKNKQRSRSSSRSKSREPWCKLLKSQGSTENLSSFNNFDPLRTLHFLARELHTKLLDTLPNDTNIQQMVLDMQQALNRVPPEIASTVVLHNAAENFSKKSSAADLRNSKLRSYSKENVLPVQEKVIQIVKAPTNDKTCQTIKNNYAEAERLQKHLEESSAKIETACKQMETVCTKLKSEKEELEIMLSAERETVKFLRKQMEEFENEKTEATNATLATLQQEKESAQTQVKILKAQIETQQGASSQECKSLIQELRNQKTDADEQITLLNHQITILNMEKEKYIAILSARDRQIKEIRSEMNQLQEVVNEQLVELQNAPCSSVPSSATNMTLEPSWVNIKNNDSHKNVSSSLNTNDTALQRIFLQDKLGTNSFKELPSGDSSGTSTMIREPHKHTTVRIKKDNGLYKRLSPQHKEKTSAGSMIDGTAYTAFSDTHANIRNMFAEIKKQALLVTAVPMHSSSQKVNDQELFHSEPSIKK